MAEDVASPVCLGLLCGIPASGKSTIARQLQKDVVQVLPGRLAVLLLQYDTLFPAHLERQSIVQSAEQGSSLWKSTRSQIKACVDQLLGQLAEGELSASAPLSHCHNPQSLSQASQNQETISGMADNLLGLAKPSDVDSALWDRFVFSVDSSVKKTVVGEKSSLEVWPSWLVLIDDNMHYSSMRYEYCQLARKCKAGFCIMYVLCPLDEAMQRNRSRSEGRVEDHVILLMHVRLEVPDHRKHSWEKHSVTVDGTATVEVQVLVELVQRAMLDPQRPSPEEDEELKVISRCICSTNVIHQADQILRKCVSQQMAEAKGQSLTEECSERELDRCEKNTCTRPVERSVGWVIAASLGLKCFHFWLYHSQIYDGRAKTIRDIT
ncbi:L-seryl-tRNA(Sec) kinase-like isoform X2 [Littorina saxatilis]|uniref:L-seryl-tRNA(Sec) kinase-like isoform X2 n=1 Tax=Littorina saxatilis TaxID=31220 RepID=UPI0038B42EF5